MNQTNTAVSIVSHGDDAGNGLAVVDPSESQLLAQLDDAYLTLSNVSRADEAQFLLGGFSAARELAKRRGYSEAARVATEGRIRAGRRLGQFIPQEYPASRPEKASPRGSLSEIGVSYNQSSRYQKLASIPEKVFESVIREIAFEEEGELSEAGILARADRILRGVNIQQSESNEWYTPAHYIEAARATLGDIDLDPASNEIANQTVKATMFYTVDDDGLAHPWIGRVFLNPPYGRMAASFIERMATEYADGNVTAGIVLVNAHCTDTSWFQCLWEGVLCFTDHRIDFYRPGDVGENKSTHGSVFVYFGPSPERFAEEFEVFGAIVQRFA